MKEREASRNVVEGDGERKEIADGYGKSFSMRALLIATSTYGSQFGRL